MQSRTVLFLHTSHRCWNWLRAAIEELPGIRLAGDAQSFAEAQALLAMRHPDLLVTGVAVDSCSTLPFVQRLSQAALPTRTVVIARRANLHELPAFTAAGASFLLWERLTDPSVAREAIARAFSEQVVLDRRGTEPVPDTGRRRRQTDALSPREREVFALMQTGKCDKEIARNLSIAAGTVRTDVHHIIEKLNVANRFELGCLSGRLRFDGALSTVVDADLNV